MLARLGGVADAATLVRHTSRRRLRTAVERGDVVRLGVGRYALPAADLGRQAAARVAGVVSHESAAAAWGWELRHPPGRPVVTVAPNRNIGAGRREGVELRWSRLALHEVRNGVTAPGRTVIDCAKRLPRDEAPTVADSALRHRDVTKALVMRLAEDVKGPHRAKVLWVARHADGRAANPFESVLRAIALDVPGLDLVPQVVIAEAGFAVRPDLVDVERRLIVEADSFEFHGRRAALKKDCERYNVLVLAGWRVLRFTWEHVMFEPELVRACLQAAVGTGPVEAAVPERLRPVA